jgi:hypothetical protein
MSALTLRLPDDKHERLHAQRGGRRNHARPRFVEQGCGQIAKSNGSTAAGQRAVRPEPVQGLAGAHRDRTARTARWRAHYPARVPMMLWLMQPGHAAELPSN